MRRVAIIDDDEVFAEALSRRLSRDAFVVESFGAANEFLAGADPAEFDLVIVDLTMADSHGVFWEFAGVDAVRAIRRAAGDGLSIWVLTGHNKPHMLKACLDNGANDFLSKDNGISWISQKVGALPEEAVAR